MSDLAEVRWYDRKTQRGARPVIGVWPHVDVSAPYDDILMTGLPRPTVAKRESRVVGMNAMVDTVCGAGKLLALNGAYPSVKPSFLYWVLGQSMTGVSEVLAGRALERVKPVVAPDEWDQAISELDRTEGLMVDGAPTAETRRDVAALVALLRQFTSVPDFVIDESVGDVSLRWMRRGGAAFLAMTCQGNGHVRIAGRDAERNPIVSETFDLANETAIVDVATNAAFSVLTSII